MEALHDTVKNVASPSPPQASITSSQPVQQPSTSL
jgi:hypothetical protein